MLALNPIHFFLFYFSYYFFFLFIRMRMYFVYLYFCILNYTRAKTFVLYILKYLRRIFFIYFKECTLHKSFDISINIVQQIQIDASMDWRITQISWQTWMKH